MLENHDFIDPRLAQKLRTFQLEISRLQKQQNMIRANPNTSKQSKIRLLNYNNQCVRTNKMLLEEVKSQMVDYYDQQIQILNKIQVQSKENTLSLQQINVKDSGNKQNLSYTMNDLSLSFRNKHRLTKTQRFSVETYKNQDSTVSGDKIADNLNSTSPISIPNRPNNVLSDSKQSYCIKQKQITPPRKPKRRKAIKYQNKNRLYQKRCKIYKNQLNAFRMGFQILMEEKYALQLKSEEDSEIIDLQNEKIRILEYKCKQLTQQKQSITNLYKGQISEVLSDHNQLKRIQAENKALLMERNLLMKKLNAK